MVFLGSCFGQAGAHASGSRQPGTSTADRNASVRLPKTQHGAGAARRGHTRNRNHARRAGDLLARSPPFGPRHRPPHPKRGGASRSIPPFATAEPTRISRPRGSTGCASPDILLACLDQNRSGSVLELPFYRGQNFTSRSFSSFLWSRVFVGRLQLQDASGKKQFSAIKKNSTPKCPDAQRCNSMACPAARCNRLLPMAHALMRPTRICILPS